MTAIRVEIPETLKTFINEQARATGMDTAEDYISKVLWDARERALQEQLEQQLLEGLRSQTIEMTPERWRKKRQELLARTVD